MRPPDPADIDEDDDVDVDPGLDTDLDLDLDAARLEAGLDEAEARLGPTLHMAAAGAGAISFDATLPAPERQLLAALRAMGEEPGAQAPQASDAVSFSPAGEKRGLARSGTKVSRFLDRVLERVGAVTRVESRVDGQLVASTTVGLTGDCSSALSLASARSDLDAHVRALGAELRARRAWARLVISTAQMAAKLALATGTGNPLLALPAAFRFIRGVMADLKQMEQAA